MNVIQRIPFCFFLAMCFVEGLEHICMLDDVPLDNGKKLGHLFC